MALTPDGPTGETLHSAGTSDVSHPDVTVSSETDHRTEIPALLGKDEIPADEDQAPETALDAAEETTGIDNDPAPENAPIPEPAIEPVIEPVVTVEPPPTAGIDVALLLESLQDSLAATRYISAKIDAVSDDATALRQQVSTLSESQELLAAEIQSINSYTTSKNVLSKTFLIVASSLLAVLVIVQIYVFVSLLNTQRLQNTAGSAVLEHITSLNKKMAQYDTNLTKVLAQPSPQEHAPQEHAQPAPGHETAGALVSPSAPVVPVLERLNKLRNGLPEKKLIRKESGDWFVYAKKNEESITDVEIIKALNQAYERIGRSLTPTVPMPAHNALCILKADGKGGTQIVMTKEFLP